MPDSVVQVVFAIIHLHFHNEVFPTAQQVFWLFTQKSVLGKRGGTDIVHLAALMGVVWRNVALMGVVWRCRTLWGGDDSTVFKPPNGPVSFNGPVGHGEQDRQPPLIQGSEPGSLKEKLQMESTSTGRPQMLESQRFVMMVGVVSEVESVAHL